LKWAKYEVLGDNDPERPARTDSDCWLNVQIAVNDALPSLICAVLNGIANGFDKITFIIAKGQL
jgi:hypothetical protein